VHCIVFLLLLLCVPAAVLCWEKCIVYVVATAVLTAIILYVEKCVDR